ncbi:F-box protein SKIP23 [Bienertia sinuspersici]
MADWSELPAELIGEILTYLNSPIDILRFRSICSTWRQSTPLNGGHQFPFSLPFHGISLFKRSIFQLSPSKTSIVEFLEKTNSWVIKVEEKNPNFFNLFFPLSWNQIAPLPINFPTVIDLFNIRIREMGHEFFLRYTDEVYCRGDFLNLLMEKVAFLSGQNGDDFFLLTIHISGGLALYNNVDNQWHVISDDLDLPYDDVIAFNGEFYAVDYVGKTVLVGTDTANSVNLVANSVCGGDQKRLVEMGGELMLVDVYMGLPPWDDDHNIEDLDEYVSSSRSVWFKVYRLDREGKTWVEVKDLGNNILFVGMTSAFAASAVDFAFHKGNCIYFPFPDKFHPSCLYEGDDIFRFHCGGVFHMEDSSISYSELFWPPPPWITSSSLEV